MTFKMPFRFFGKKSKKQKPNDVKDRSKKGGDEKRPKETLEAVEESTPVSMSIPRASSDADAAKGGNKLPLEAIAQRMDISRLSQNIGRRDFEEYAEDGDDEEEGSFDGAYGPEEDSMAQDRWDRAERIGEARARAHKEDVSRMACVASAHFLSGKGNIIASNGQHRNSQLLGGKFKTIRELRRQRQQGFSINNDVGSLDSLSPRAQFNSQLPALIKQSRREEHTDFNTKTKGFTTTRSNCRQAKSSYPATPAWSFFVKNVNKSGSKDAGLGMHSRQSILKNHHVEVANARWEAQEVNAKILARSTFVNIKPHSTSHNPLELDESDDALYQ